MKALYYLEQQLRNYHIVAYFAASVIVISGCAAPPTSTPAFTEAQRINQNDKLMTARAEGWAMYQASETAAALTPSPTPSPTTTPQPTTMPENALAWLDGPPTLKGFSPRTDIAWVGTNQLAVWDYAANMITIYSMENMKEIWSTQQATIGSFTFSPDGSLLVVAQTSGELKVWQVGNRQPIHVIENDSPLSDPPWDSNLCFSPDGDRLLTARADSSELRVLDAQTSDVLLTLTFQAPDYGDGLGQACWSPDGTKVIAGSFQDIVRVWDAENGRMLFSLDPQHELVTANDKIILTRSSYPSDPVQTSVDLWNSTNGAHQLKIPFDQFVGEISLSPDGGMAAIDIGDVHLYNMLTGAEILTFENNGGFTSPTFSHDGTMLAAGSGDEVVIWDVATGKILHVLRGHIQSVNKLLWSHDDTLLVSASDDGTAIVWSPMP